MVEMGEGSVVVRAAVIVAPLRLVLELFVELDVLVTGDGVRRGLTVVEVGERAVVVGVARVVTPAGLVGQGLIELHVFLDDAVGRGLAMVKVSEWAVVVRRAIVVAPFRLVIGLVLLGKADGLGSAQQDDSLLHLFPM